MLRLRDEGLDRKAQNEPYGEGDEGCSVEKEYLTSEMTKTIQELHVDRKMQASWHI